MLFIYTSYTANIVALLQSTTKDITTLKHLLHSPIELGVEDTPYSRYYFPHYTEPLRRAIYQQKISPPNKPPRFMNISYGVSRLRQVCCEPQSSSRWLSYHLSGPLRLSHGTWSWLQIHWRHLFREWKMRFDRNRIFGVHRSVVCHPEGFTVQGNAQSQVRNPNSSPRDLVLVKSLISFQSAENPRARHSRTWKL